MVWYVYDGQTVNSKYNASNRQTRTEVIWMRVHKCRREKKYNRNTKTRPNEIQWRQRRLCFKNYDDDRSFYWILSYCVEEARFLHFDRVYSFDFLFQRSITTTVNSRVISRCLTWGALNIGKINNDSSSPLPRMHVQSFNRKLNCICWCAPTNELGFDF